MRLVASPVRLTPIILFVRRFDRCFTFYRQVFGLKAVRVYGDPPRWAEFQVGDVRLALHGGYRGPRQHQGRPVALHFVAGDIRRAIRCIRRYGGAITPAARKVDPRPAEQKVAIEATFRDPDGNTFDVQQVLAAYHRQDTRRR